MVIGKEPETRYFEESRGVANFSLATTEKGHTTASGAQIQERTEWHNITVWRKGLVEIVEKYVHKGSKIHIEGKIRSRSYVNKQEIKRYVTEIHADSIELLDRKTDGENKPLPLNLLLNLPQRGVPFRKTQPVFQLLHWKWKRMICLFS